MTARPGLGLRMQILASLFVSVVLAFTALETAAVRLDAHARARERHDAAASLATVLARATRGPMSYDRFADLADVTIGRANVVGVKLVRPGQAPWQRGLASGEAVVASIEGGGSVELRLRPASGPEEHAQLLLLYALLTGGAIVLGVYLALTTLIVRPVEAVTQASERMARGHLEIELPARGAREVVRLGTAFNAMAAQIRADRGALEARLEELVRTTAHLREAQDEVVRTAKLASIGRLAAGVAHEIGNPLAAILGMLELVRGGDVPPDEQQEFLGRILAETERIHAIIRDLLDFARQGRASDEDETATADVARVVEDALGLVAPRGALRGARVVRGVPEGLPRVRGSHDRLQQVLINLLLNAGDALDGEGTVTLTARTVGDELELVVEDTGPGIDPAVLPHVFEPFVTTKPVGKGTGLGLAVCHTIVERTGGTLRAENREGGGARFVVVLPFANGPSR